MNKNKKRGFTLIEIMVVLAISVIIAGTIYTFYNTNNRALSAVEVKSTLQTEGNAIQKELITIGTQAKGIVIDGNPNLKNDDLEKGSYNVEKFELSIIPDESQPTVEETYVFKLIGDGSKKGGTKELKIFKGPDEPTVESTVTAKSVNVKSIEVRPLDSKTNLVSDCSGVEVIVNLYIEKGFNKTSYPVSTIVKFRNKGFQ